MFPAKVIDRTTLSIKNEKAHSREIKNPAFFEMGFYQHVHIFLQHGYT
jgi:hypothetical protein